MSIAHQIQIAADLLELELSKQGIFSISKAECLRIARVLYSAWTFTRDTSHLAPGEIAQNHRTRYERNRSDVNFIWPNIIDDPCTGPLSESGIECITK